MLLQLFSSVVVKFGENYALLYICPLPTTEAIAHGVVPSEWRPSQEHTQFVVWAGENSNLNPELEFLNTLPNPGILKSQDLRSGGIRRYFSFGFTPPL